MFSNDFQCIPCERPFAQIPQCTLIGVQYRLLFSLHQARLNEFSIGAASQGKKFTIHESEASGVSNGVGSRGPLKGP